MPERYNNCRVLVAEWLANFSIDGIADYYKKPYHIISTPQTIALSILTDFRICKRMPNHSGFMFVVKKEKFRQKIEDNISKGVSFRKIFQAFMEIAIYFGGAEERQNVPFLIHGDVKELYQELECLGYVKIVGKKVQWTRKVNAEIPDRYDLPFLTKIDNLESRSLSTASFRYRSKFF